jgi:hypothetical protein
MFIEIGPGGFDTASHRKKHPRRFAFIFLGLIRVFFK